MAALSGPIAKLSVHLGLETAAFEKGTKRATKEVSAFEKNMTRASGAVKTAFVGMLGAFAVDQLVTAAKDALDYAGSLGEVAKQLGVSTDALQSFRYIATQVGVEQDEMDKGLSKLTRTIGEAVTGSGKAADLFDRLGISVRDSTGQVKSAEAILPEIANAYNRLGSEAEKSALSAEVFGAKLGQKLNPALELGAQGIAGMVREAHELGLVLSKDVIDNADTASDTLTTLSNVMKLQFTAAVAGNAKEIAYLGGELINLLNTLGKVTRAFRGFANIRESEGMWEALTTDFSELGNYATREDYVTSYYGKKPLKFKPNTSMPKVDPRFLGGTGMSRQTPFSIGPKAPWPTTKAVGASAFGGMDMSQFTPGQGEGFIRMAAAVKEMAPSVTGIAASFASMSDTDAPRLLATIRQMKPELEALRNATQGILDRLFPDEAEARRYAEELAILNAALAKGQISLNTHAGAVTALRREYSGFTAAIEEAAQVLSTEVGPSLDEISDAISDRLPRQLAVMGDDADAATVRVASSFADMAESISSSLSSIAGGKTGRILSSLLSIGLQLGKAGAFGGDVSSFLNRIPARARGGPVSAGTPYLVGERGPELVVPRHGGNVIPNNKLGGPTVVEIVDTTGLFVTRVNGQIVDAAPHIARAGAVGGVGLMKQQQSRRYSWSV